MLGTISAFAYRHRETKNFELAMSKLVLQTAAGDCGRFRVLQAVVSLPGLDSSGALWTGAPSRRWITNPPDTESPVALVHCQLKLSIKLFLTYLIDLFVIVL